MPRTARFLTSAVGGLLVLGISAISSGQSVAGGGGPTIGLGAAFAPGSIQGVVADEKGNPLAGAMVTALGTTAATAVTDREGRFELRTLSPGPYLVRAHLPGYLAPHPRLVDVRPSARTSSSLALRRAVDTPTVLAAAMGALPSEGSQPPATGADAPVETSDTATEHADDDHGETAWRIRHGRHGVLKEAMIPDELFAEADQPSGGVFVPVDFLGRAAGSSARLAGLFADVPFSGQVNLLTSGSFDTPQELFSTNALTRGVANISLTAPIGSQADWTVRGALTQADISSWVVAGSYRTRAPAVHSYEMGLSYSTQRYSGGNLFALRDVADGSRNVGAVYGFDMFTVSPVVSVTYGARYSRYDYLQHRNLVSPRVELSVAPSDHLRVDAMVSRREIAPGAEEFVPPAETGIWLPPQRTFSSLDPVRQLDAERATHVAIEAERDFGRSTLTLRAFHQHVDGQLLTVFGAEMPGQPAAKVGHYFVGDAGEVNATGCAAAIRSVLSEHVKGSVEYTLARAQLTPADQLQYFVLLPAAALRAAPQRIHNVSTSIEANVPETSMRVLVLYRVSNAFARPAVAGPAGSDTTTRLDSRFDVQLRQSLPFMDFSNARWEMLVAVRNFFREAATDQGMYDELLVVRPPKRIVGGLTMRF